MQNSLNNDGLYRVYFNSIAQHFVLIHENLWNSFDTMPSDKTWFLEKVYAGTESECEDFIRMQRDPQDPCYE
jgi:hypothetical protein